VRATERKCRPVANPLQIGLRTLVALRREQGQRASSDADKRSVYGECGRCNVRDRGTADTSVEHLSDGGSDDSGWQLENAQRDGEPSDDGQVEQGRKEEDGACTLAVFNNDDQSV